MRSHQILLNPISVGKPKFDPIKGLGHIQLDNGISSLVDVIHEFVSQADTVVNAPPLDKGRLLRRNNSGKDFVEALREDLGNNLMDVVAETDWTKVRKRCRVRLLWNKHEDRRRNRMRNRGPPEKVLNSRNQVGFDNMPTMDVESSCVTIGTWGAEGGKSLSRCPNLILLRNGTNVIVDGALNQIRNAVQNLILGWPEVEKRPE